MRPARGNHPERHGDLVWHADAGRGGVRALAYAPDGGTLYAVTGAGRVQAWDAGTRAGRELFRVDGVDYLAVAVNPVTHDLLVHARSNSTICGYWAWRPGLGRLVNPPHGRPWPDPDLTGGFNWISDDVLSMSETTAMAFDAVGKAIYCLKPGGDRVVREQYTGPAARPSRGFDRLVQAAVRLAGTPDGRRIAVATARGTVVVWDTAADELVAQVKLAGGTRPTAIALSSLGTLAVALADELRFYDADTGTLTAAAVTARPMTHVAVSPASDAVVTADGSAAITVWDAAGRVSSRFDWKVGRVRALAFAPDGLTCAVGGTARPFAVFDV